MITDAGSGRIDLSLDRIKSLLDRLQSPQNRYPVIHIAGTNGKGSTSAYLDSILTNVVGVRTARFNSPHLVEERDCCRISGNVVSQAQWEAAQEVVGNESSALECTPFELLVAKAFVLFRSLPEPQAPDVVILEVGMGGRLDATNVLMPRNVLASVICPVDKDHEAFLGNTIPDIAKEKAGIIPGGGLCVIGDQRKWSNPQVLNTEVDSTTIRSLTAEQGQIGEHAATVVDTLRSAAIEKGARLVKSYVPWASLLPTNLGSTALKGTAAQRPTASAVLRYAPTLFPSILPTTPNDFVARPGDPVVSGSTIRVSATQAALGSACTALQTLFSIARDEPPSAFGAAGSDMHEELKLQIAFAMRDDRETAARIQDAIDRVTWEGRCAFLPLPMATPPEPAAEDPSAEVPEQPVEAESGPVADTADTDAQRTEKAETSEPLIVLADGAHNPASAAALRDYVNAYFHVNSATSATVTWVMGFSKGKDIESMLRELFHGTPKTAKTEGLAESVAAMSLAGDVRHSIAFLPFSTPVEGMPWIEAASVEDCEAALKAVAAPNVEEVKSFEELDAALAWAKAIDAERKGTTHLTVVCGSLYLIGDLYRLYASRLAH